MSYTEEIENKQRLFTIKASIAYGGVIAKLYKVYDRSFTMYEETPGLFNMGHGSFVCLAHPSIDGVVLEYMIQVAIIEPQAEILRYVHLAILSCCLCVLLII